MKKLVGLVLLIVSALVLSTTALADESGVVASGYCGGEGDGTNLTWTLTEDGTLTISGEGAMKEGAINDSLKYYNISNLIIEEGVTSIGYGAFWSYSNIKGNLVIPSSVTTIENFAFCSCTGFRGNLIIPDSVVSIGDFAFNNCRFDGNLIIGKSVKKIGEHAFYECDDFIGELIIPKSVETINSYAFFGCKIKEYYFEGDAPEVSTDIFDTNSDTIYYPAGNTTWIIENGKWKGYTAVEWNMNENEECEHVPAEAVKENEVKATNDRDGSYDSVVYCSLCGEELRRETVSVPATGNHASNNQGGYNSSVVISIGKTESEQNPNTGAFTPSGMITVIMGGFILSFYKKRK